MKLIRQGFYREMPHGEVADPSINDYIGKGIYGDDKFNILHYLQSGTVVVICCGTCNDIIKPENGVAGVPSFYTDGKWVWPGDLRYYVDQYDLLLSPEFIEDMKRNHWEIKCDSLDVDNIEII